MRQRIMIYAAVLALAITCVGFAEGAGDAAMNYRTEEIWCQNGTDSIYGVAYIPETEGKKPLVIFSHELGSNHESGIRYAERLAQNGRVNTLNANGPAIRPERT